MNRFIAVALAFLVATGCATAGSPPAPQRVASMIQVERLRGGLGISGSATPRPMPQIATEVIKDFEGWVEKPYDDPSDYCTVGYGHLIALHPCNSLSPLPFVDGLTKNQGLVLLDKDTGYARLAVQSLVAVKLTEEQFGALSSFVYNIGADKFSGSTLRILLNEGKPDLAAKQFGLWIKSKGKVLPGLIDRRACEAAVFSGFLKIESDRPFKRSDCASLGAAPPMGQLIDLDVGER